MTTAQDLSILAFIPEADTGLERGDLSLALAGAELIDLVEAGVVTLDDDRIVPRTPAPRTEDALLGEAASTLASGPSSETVEDWLWRRGSELAGRYRAALEAAGLVAPERSRPHLFRRDRGVPAGAGTSATADASTVDRAEARREAGDPLLTSLAAAVGMGEVPEATLTGLPDDAATVVTAVHQAITELAAERQRRSIEGAAFDNIWRGY
ncbi:GPP34 family phosphoprotein [Streptomyces sp. NPDC048590]|uniref:GOLPH3/VPS74 family protein n=1 Tax=Streptomyces sp. NPDC048590 TaxID=3365574 RepID=UPI003722DE9C